MLRPLLPTLCGALLQPSKLVCGNLAGIASQITTVARGRSCVDDLTGMGPNWRCHLTLPKRKNSAPEPLICIYTRLRRCTYQRRSTNMVADFVRTVILG